MRNTTADAAGMVSTNAGRASSLAAAGAAITPCSVVCEGIAYAGTIVGIAADAVGQLAMPNAGQYIFSGLTAIAANFSSSVAPVFSPFMNELTNGVNGSGVAGIGQDSINSAIGIKPPNGKQ